MVKRANYLCLYLVALIRGLFSPFSPTICIPTSGVNVIFNSIDLKKGFGYYQLGAKPYVVYLGLGKNKAIFVDKQCPSVHFKA